MLGLYFNLVNSIAWYLRISSWAKLIGRTAEVPAEVRHTVKIRADGCIGEVATLQLLQHELT